MSDGNPMPPPLPPIAPAATPLAITADMLDPLPPPPAGPRDFERGMSYVPIVALLLIAANVAAYVWEVSQIGIAPKSGQAYIDVGALHRASVLAGQFWRLVTAMFLHGGIDHLLGNVLMLYVVGMGVEHAFGRAKTLAIYFAAGIAGSAASLCWDVGPSVGASGAIFGLVGVLIAFFRRHRDVFFVRDKRIGFVLLAWALYTVATGLLSPEIDNACHLGGLFAGLLLGWFVPMKPVDPFAGQERAFFVRPR